VLWHPQMEHTLFETGVDLVFVDGDRQGHCPHEGTKTALLTMLHRFLEHRRLALALERELVVPRDEDLQVLQLEPRQLRFQMQRISVFPEIEDRHRRQTEEMSPAIAPLIEQPIHLALQIMELGPDRSVEWRPT